MLVTTDKFVERATKGGEVYHNFNTAIDCGECVLYVPGWQMFSGIINPPSFRSGRRFYPMILATGNFSRLLYDELDQNAKCRELGLKLRPFDEAIQGLNLTSMEFARLFPNF